MWAPVTPPVHGIFSCGYSAGSKNRVFDTQLIPSASSCGFPVRPGCAIIAGSLASGMRSYGVPRARPSWLARVRIAYFRQIRSPNLPSPCHRSHATGHNNSVPRHRRVLRWPVAETSAIWNAIKFDAVGAYNAPSMTRKRSGDRDASRGRLGSEREGGRGIRAIPESIDRRCPTSSRLAWRIAILVDHGRSPRLQGVVRALDDPFIPVLADEEHELDITDQQYRTWQRIVVLEGGTVRCACLVGDYAMPENVVRFVSNTLCPKTHSTSTARSTAK